LGGGSAVSIEFSKEFSGAVAVVGFINSAAGDHDLGSVDLEVAVDGSGQSSLVAMTANSLCLPQARTFAATAM
jgi:hypothetical protein